MFPDVLDYRLERIGRKRRLEQRTFDTEPDHRPGPWEFFTQCCCRAGMLTLARPSQRMELDLRSTLVGVAPPPTELGTHPGVLGIGEVIDDISSAREDRSDHVFGRQIFSMHPIGLQDGLGFVAGGTSPGAAAPRLCAVQHYRHLNFYELWDNLSRVRAPGRLGPTKASDVGSALVVSRCSRPLGEVMKRAYDVSDSPRRDPSVSPVIRFCEFVFVSDNVDVVHPQQPTGKGSGWMPHGVIEDVPVSLEAAGASGSDVVKVNTFHGALDRGSRVHYKESRESIPEIPPTRITEDAKTYGEILIEIECVVCAPAA